MVMSRGQDERVLIDDGAKWMLQEQRDRTAGVKALHSVLASTTSGRASL